MHKVVVHYRSGTLLKGHAWDFAPGTGFFHVTPVEGPASSPARVALDDLKAVFFVRDFTGDSTYDEVKAFSASATPAAHRIEAFMFDGEVLVGSADVYEPEALGFFLVPADPRSNNVRCFVVAAAVKRLSVV